MIQWCSSMTLKHEHAIGWLGGLAARIRWCASLGFGFGGYKIGLRPEKDLEARRESHRVMVAVVELGGSAEAL